MRATNCFVRQGVKANPGGRFAALVGDLNIRAEGEKSFKIGQDLEGRILYGGYSNPLFHLRLLSLLVGKLKDWIEIIQPLLNHYNPQHKTCTRNVRCWIHCPSNLLIECSVASRVFGSPEECYGSGLSSYSLLGSKV